MLSTATSNSRSLFSLTTTGDGAPNQLDLNDTNGQIDFLPSVSFDDLQSSLESASNDFRLVQITNSPEPSRRRPTPDEGCRIPVEEMAGQQTNGTLNGGATRLAMQPNPTPNAAAGGTRTGRTGSILGRGSASSRQISLDSTTSVSSSFSEAPNASTVVKGRRPNHCPPAAGSTLAFAKQSRKPSTDVQAGIARIEKGAGPAQKRQSSLTTTGGDRDPSAPSTNDVFTNSAGRQGDHVQDASQFRTTRVTKAKSMQPLPRFSAQLSVAGSSVNTPTPEGNRKSVTFPRSPRTSSLVSTAGSTKRMSVMPGAHSSTGHATGLGARTISPTDAQRAKRLSMHQSQGLTLVADAPVSVSEPRPTSRSPSRIPRKTSTPSSPRTSPEGNNNTRKSCSSRVSANSVASLNTHRTSTGSCQRGLPQTASTSRLPAPKLPTVHSNPPAGDEDEDVPPVPAIPKAFESPKDTSAESAFVVPGKSSQAFDSSSIQSSSTGTSTQASHELITSKAQPKASVQRRASKSTLGGITAEVERKATTASSKRNLAPLRLPPLNLGPLSTPTEAKIAALHDGGQGDDKPGTPPARITARTPTTPMTASRSTLFSRSRGDRQAEHVYQRSNTAVHHNRLESPAMIHGSSSAESLAAVSKDEQVRKSNVSPYLSSSVPKNENAFAAHMTRSKTSGGVNKTATTDSTISVPELTGTSARVAAGPSIAAASDFRPSQKPTGPRAPKMATPAAKSPPVRESPEEPPTPSSMSSLRRKLSLSWKRSNSKSSNNHPYQSATEHGSGHVRKESMPPPRLPVSATLGSMNAPNQKQTATYLESRRRKSSASNLTAGMAPEKNSIWSSPKKASGGSSNPMAEASAAARATSSVQRMLRPRPSATNVKVHDSSGTEMDKDDLVAEEEMRKLASRRKETELAARTLDALRKRASAKPRVGAQDALRMAMLNVYEKGEIVDYTDIYFCGTQNAAKVQGDLNSSAPNFGYDDDRGDYSIVVGDHLAYRYEIVDVLGKGSFGQVVRCIDHRTGALVAVKIIRNKKRFHQQALVEVNILQKLRDWDPKNKHSMVNFTHSFYFRNHLCISTELLDMNLYEFIKSNAFRGFSLKLIRRFTKQMLSSLTLLKQHKVIHCDLKPENILLRHPAHSEIKVIDFGSSCFENEKVYTYIQSRFYRSPEVILGMTYGLPIDMWSLGCILAELYTGVPIFPGENEQEQLACIMEVFGPPEKHLIEKSTRKKLFFDSMGKPRLSVSSKGRRRRPSSKSLPQALKCDDEAFLDFIARCLRWDPERRLKPEDAIRHEFITGQKASAPVARTRDGSPVKRHSTFSAPRPLPEAPAGRAGAGYRAREAVGTGGSPQKIAVSGATRRASNLGPSFATTTKRTSLGQGSLANAGPLGSSNLPRVAGRNVSARQDLASAGANAAMSRRA